MNRPTWPDSVIIFGTFRCNQHCPFCGQEEIRDHLVSMHPERPELICHLLRSMPETTSVHFSGGEFLAISSCRVFMGVVVERGMHFTFTTNGVLLDRHQDFLLRWTPEKIIVSIDSLDPDRYAELRGTPRGTLQKVLSNVAALAANRDGLPRLKLNLVVQPQNVAEISSVARTVRELGFDEMSLSHLQWSAKETRAFHTTANAACNGPSLAAAIDLQELDRQIEILPDWVEQHPPLQGEKLRAYYVDPMSWLGETCSWPETGCYVMPDGRVFNCGPFYAGTLADGPLREIWASPEMRDFRQRIRDGLLPECRTCCHLQFENSVIRRFVDLGRDS